MPQHHIPDPPQAATDIDSWYWRGWFKDMWNWSKRQSDTATLQTSSFQVSDHFLYPANTTGGNITATLPAAAANRGRPLAFQNYSGANNLVVTPQTGETVGGAASDTLGAGTSGWYVSDGISNWYKIIAGSGGGGGGSALTVKDEGVSLDTAVTSINFVGTGVTATNVGHAITVTVPTPAATISTQDEGTPLSSTVTTLNFVGAGVTASGAGATTTVTIPSSTTNAAGSDKQIQFNDGGTAFGADADFTWDKTTNTLTFANGSTLAGTLSVSNNISFIGDIVKIRNQTTTFPAANAIGFLLNNGSGTLSWSGSLPSSQSYGLVLATHMGYVRR